MALSLQEAIARVPQWIQAIDVKTTPLGGGITNKNFRVDVQDESFVLRMPGANTDLLGIERENEYLANLAAGKIGVAPEVYYFIRPEGYLITRFIEARPLPPHELRHPDNIRQIALMLRQIHALPELPRFFLVDQIVADYTKVAQDHNVPFPANFEWLLARLNQAYAAFRHDPVALVACHNDLLNENFLQRDGQIVILDWEYAGMGDPFFDLANLSVNHEFSDEEDRLLLESYFDTLTDARWARLKIFKILSDFRESMWGLVQIGISTLDFDFRAYADKHFERLTRNLKDPRWGDWLASIQNK